MLFTSKPCVSCRSPCTIINYNFYNKTVFQWQVNIFSSYMFTQFCFLKYSFWYEVCVQSMIMSWSFKTFSAVFPLWKLMCVFKLLVTKLPWATFKLQNLLHLSRYYNHLHRFNTSATNCKKVVFLSKKMYHKKNLLILMVKINGFIEALASS